VQSVGIIDDGRSLKVVGQEWGSGGCAPVGFRDKISGGAKPLVEGLGAKTT